MHLFESVPAGFFDEDKFKHIMLGAKGYPHSETDPVMTLSLHQILGDAKFSLYEDMGFKIYDIIGDKFKRRKRYLETVEKQAARRERR